VVGNEFGRGHRSSGSAGAAKAHEPIIVNRRRRAVGCRRLNDSQKDRQEWSTQKGRAREGRNTGWSFEFKEQLR